MVKLSLDCASQKCLKKLDRAEKSINIDDIKRGILTFKNIFKGELIIEVLFVKGINNKDTEILKLNNFLEELNPTRVDIGSIDRPPAYGVEAIDYKQLREISLKFNPKLPITITSRKYNSISQNSYSKEQILNTLKKRPLTQDDIDILFDEKSKNIFRDLLKSKIKTLNRANQTFFIVKE